MSRPRRSKNSGTVKFIQHLTTLVVNEWEYDKKTNHGMMQGSSLNLEKRGVAILNLKIINTMKGIGGSCNLLLEIHTSSRTKSSIPQHRIVIGDIVGLMEFNPYNENDSNRNDTPQLSGIIAGVSKTRVLLSLSNSQDSVTLPKSVDLFKIVKLPNNISHERMLQTLQALKSICINRRQEPPKLIQVLFGQRTLGKPNEQQQRSIKFYNNDLNEDQKEAVRFSLTSPEVALIHGPPGKTHTLIEIIRQLVAQKKRILVCGPSNISVDNLVQRTSIFCANIVRLGHPVRVALTSIAWTLDVLCCGKNRATVESYIQEILREQAIKLRTSAINEADDKNKIQEKLNKYFKKMKITRSMKEDRIRAANVVFSTLNGSGNRILKGRKFDVVIIDEAAQATEPDCWIALMKGRKVIMAGDHLQLPPTVISPPVNPYSRETQAHCMSRSGDLSYTLFDRTLSMHGNKVKRLLSIQYRMHSKIMEYSSKQLYENRLVAHKSVATQLLHDLPKVIKTKNTAVPIITIDTKDTMQYHEAKGTGQFDKQSTANSLEVKIVANQVKKLLTDGISQSQIAVITPYKAQVTKIRAELGEKWLDIEVGTVDGFQGKEKEVVLLSLVRSNSLGEVGFLADKRRLNVAMTRAKRQLVVVCDSRTLNGGETVKPAVESSDGWITQVSSKSKKLASRQQGSSHVIDTTFLRNWIAWLMENSQVIESEMAFSNKKTFLSLHEL